MFALVLSEDRISMIERRRETIQALNNLPGNCFSDSSLESPASFPSSVSLSSKLSACSSVSDLIRQVLALDNQCLEIAREIYKEKSLLIMGRGLNFATCLEGALKIKVCY